MSTRSRSKRTADDEPTAEIPMDAQSPETANTPQAAKITSVVEDLQEESPPKTTMPNAAQKLRKHAETIKNETEEVLCQIECVCKENEEKSEAMKKLTEEVSALREMNATLQEQLRSGDQEKQEMAEKLKHLDGEYYQLKISSESLRRSFLELSEEKSKYVRQVSEQSEDLHANQQEINRLMLRLKDAKRAEERLSVVLARKQALEMELKDKDEKLKEAVKEYKLQLVISGELSGKTMTQQQQNSQLIANLEHVNAQLSASLSELEKKTCEVSELKTNEQGLQLLLQDSQKQITEWKQRCEELNEHLLKVATLVNTAVNPEEQGAEKQVRNNLRSLHGTPGNEVSGVIVMDGLGSFNALLSSASHPQRLPSLSALPICNLPDVSTTILSHFAGRIAPKWFEVAHALGVGELATSLQQTEMSPERKCLQCLEAWINNGPELGCSWERLLKELCFFQLHSVARDIRDTIQEMSSSHHSI